MMRRLNLLVVSLVAMAMLAGLVAVTPAQAAGRQNSYPVVLVHGFMGWGRDELLGYKYWGGLTDIQQDLRNAGYATYTVAVGPVSSNWERACELYAEIKGGTVDYGLAHSRKYGLARYGRTYPGLYPQWGQLDATGQLNKIHLLSHSMGGQTVRILVQLLEAGSAEEIAATPASQLSPLFRGGKSWVDGVLTVSAPHDGTTLASGVGMIPLIKQTLELIAAGAGATGEQLYDFKLDQWGLTRQAGESFSSYADRVYNSNIWNTQDISAYDLTPDGAAQINRWVHAQSDVYYFSVATDQTYQGWLTGHYYPSIGMNPLLSAFSTFMGAYTRNQAGQVRLDDSWWQNDGVVNTRSMAGPTLNSSDVIVNYNGTAQRGRWNYLGVMSDYDHFDIIGTGLRDMRPQYRQWVALLAGLPR